MNRQIRRLGLVLLVCFAALFIRLNVVQVFGAQRLAEDPINTRTIVEDFGTRRGNIVTADGVVIARSVEVDGQLQRERQYPLGERYGHLTGWYAFNYGASGLERTWNDELAGRENPVPVTDILDLLAPVDTSADLHLSIDDRLQQVAQNALGDRRGSVIALDPSSGAVRAMWSWPSFDPNPISSTDLESADLAWEQLRDDPDNPALARSYRELFAPGSTFKIVTAAAALETGAVTEFDPVFEPAPNYVPPLTTSPIGNFGGGTCGGTIADIIRDSCNSAFAQLGAELIGPEAMIDAAVGVGFNEVPPIDLPDAVASRFPTDFGERLSASALDPDVDIVENTPALAQSSIGQFDVRATPLGMALVAAAVANDGLIVEPQLMERVISSEGDVVAEREPRIWRQAFSVATAAQLRSFMMQVVTNGTAQTLAMPGLEVGAKTGTAQTVVGQSTDDTHAWIIAFAGPPGASSEIAVAVVVEAVPGGGQQTGGTVAAPIARAVIEAALAAG